MSKPKKPTMRETINKLQSNQQLLKEAVENQGMMIVKLSEEIIRQGEELGKKADLISLVK